MTKPGTYKAVTQQRINREIEEAQAKPLSTYKYITGRPPAYASPEQLAAKIDEYFDKTEKEDKPRTIIGLINHLKIHKSVFYRMCDKPDYNDVIKRAKTIVEEGLCERLLEGKGNYVGSIFLLKNHHGYSDKSEVNVNQRSINLSINWDQVSNNTDNVDIDTLNLNNKDNDLD